MSKRKAGLTLTDKEKMFCTEYIIDLDATQAAIRAGYSGDSATTTAYHIKQRPDVAAYINQLLEEKTLRLRITADQVLLELAKIVFAEIGDTGRDNEPEEAHSAAGEAPLPPKESLRTDAASQETSQSAETGADNKAKAGAPKYTSASMCRVMRTDPLTGERTIIWFNLQAKIAALKILAKHLGLFEKQNPFFEKYKNIDVIYPGSPDDEGDE